MTQSKLQKELRYLSTGLDTLNDAARSLIDHSAGHHQIADDGRRQLSAILTALSDELQTMKVLFAVQTSIQLDILAALQSPVGMQADELHRRAVSAASRGLWAEAIHDYDRSIALNWDQPQAYLGRGLAHLATNGHATTNRGLLSSAAESFEGAVRYGAQTYPTYASRALQLAVILRDRLGQRKEADTLFQQGLPFLTRSPEVVFAYALR